MENVPKERVFSVENIKVFVFFFFFYGSKRESILNKLLT